MLTAQALEIWVVDHDSETLQKARECLKDDSWRVHLCASPDALNYATLDLLIINADTPGADNIIARLKQRDDFDTLPILITATPDHTLSDAMLADGELLYKPLSHHRLRGRVQARLRSRGLTLALERKRREASFLLGMSRTLHSSLDLQQVLRELVEGASTALEVERCSIFLFNAQGERWPACRLMVASDDRTLTDVPIDVAQYPEIIRVLDTQAPLLIDDVAASPLLASVGAVLHEQGVRSMALFPMKVAAELVGVLFFRSTEPQWPGSQERVSLGQATAHIAAIAIRNAGMYQAIADELLKRHDTERRLAQVSEELERARRQAITIELAGATAHKLSQPLTSALGNAEILKMQLPEEAPGHAPADRVLEQLRRMADILKMLANLDSYKTTTYVGKTQILDLDSTQSDPADD